MGQGQRRGKRPDRQAHPLAGGRLRQVRGAGKAIWKLEDCIYDLISQCEEVLSDTPLFFAVNSYTTGLSPAVMEYMLKTTLVPRFGGKTSCDEIGLPVSATGGVVPCGATAIWEE